MENVKITFNGDAKEFPKNTTYFEISKNFNMDKFALAVSVNNVIHNLGKKVKNDEIIEFVKINDVTGLNIYKSGIKFIFSVALKRVLPEAEALYEHSVPKGILVNIKYDKEITYDVLSAIKKEMSNIVSADMEIKKLSILKNEAIDFYKENGYLEKALNIQHILDKVVTLYKLDNNYNYFYTEMPFKTGIITKYEIKSIDKNKLIIMTPDKNGKVPDYSNSKSIINSFYRGKCFLNDLDMNYLADLNQNICDMKIKDFIKSSEIVFNLNLVQAAKQISDNKNIRFVMIAGPSSSGKTTTCARLADYLRTNGYDPIKISVDDYFVNREDTPKDENGNYDFECLTAIDLEAFNQDLEDLLNHKEINLRRYNFITGKKELLDKKLVMKENSIFIIEGLHAINDELTPKISTKYKYKIYLSPFIPLNIDRHNYISTIDLRLIRRIIRDARTRGYDVIKTLEGWQSVRNGEEKYVFPYIGQADIIINTALAYEVGVLKAYIEPLLYSVDIDSKYYEESKRLLNFLKPFFCIPSEYVPENSILREFIGGRNND